MDKRQKKSGHFERLLTELSAVEIQLPIPIQHAVEGEPEPLALSVRQELPAWCAAHGYSEAQGHALAKLIGLLVGRTAYLEVVAAGGSRFNLDGVEEGAISDTERGHARRRLAMHQAKQQAAALAEALNARPPSSSSTAPVPTSPDGLSAALTNLSAALGPRFSAPPALSGRVLEVHAKRRRRIAQKLEPAASRASPSEPTVPARPQPPGFVPALVVRETVERIGGRRSSVRLIAAHSKAGHPKAAAAEQAGWIADTVRALVDDGYAREAVEAQVAKRVDDMLVGIIPRQGR